MAGQDHNGAAPAHVENHVTNTDQSHVEVPNDAALGKRKLEDGNGTIGLEEAHAKSAKGCGTDDPQLFARPGASSGECDLCHEHKPANLLSAAPPQPQPVQQAHVAPAQPPPQQPAPQQQAPQQPHHQAVPHAAQVQASAPTATGPVVTAGTTPVGQVHAYSNVHVVAASTQPPQQTTTAGLNLLMEAAAQPVTVMGQPIAAPQMTAPPPAADRATEYEAVRVGQPNMPIQEWRQKAKAAIEIAAAAISTGTPADADSIFLQEMMRSADYFPRNEAKKYVRG